MFKRIKIPFFALVLTSMTLCGFWCEPIDEDMGPFSIEDCVDYYRYKLSIPPVIDSLKLEMLHESVPLYLNYSDYKKIRKELKQDE